MSIELFIAATLIVFLWNPQTGPEITRYLSQARRQFEETLDELPGTLDKTLESYEVFPNDPIIVAAKSLGIMTEGKTKQDLAKEITART